MNSDNFSTHVSFYKNFYVCWIYSLENLNSKIYTLLYCAIDVEGFVEILPSDEWQEKYKNKVFFYNPAEQLRTGIFIEKFLWNIMYFNRNLKKLVVQHIFCR